MAVFDNLNYSYSPGVAPAVTEFFEKDLLENLKPEMVHSRDGQKRSLPAHNGKYTVFRRFTPFGAITTPLAEGVTPEGQKLEQTAFRAMVKPYGGHVEITDEFNLYLLDDMTLETSKLLRDQAALSLDTISRNALHSGMNVQYPDGKTARGEITRTDVLTPLMIKKAVRNLKRKNVRPFSDGFYHAIVHPDTIYDLTADKVHWIDVATYQDKGRIEKYELGTMYDVKFFESTNAMVFQPQDYIIDGTNQNYGTIAEIAASAKVDAENKRMAYAVDITEDQGRALTGLLVNVSATDGGETKVTPMCIERVDVKNKFVYFRWMPEKAVTDTWTTANGTKIVPYGAGAGDVDVYSTLIYGENAFGTIEFNGNGKNVEVYVDAPGSSGALDPLHQRGSIAWKVKGFTTVILQDDFIVRLEHGASE